MEKYYIGTLNNISKAGLACLTDAYELTDDIDKANGIIVRSYKMHDMEFSDDLLAIGRAGAGVNNIPLNKCADKGIVVFNAPGANANAVKEIVIEAMLMAARNTYEGIAWTNSLTDGVAEKVEKGKKAYAGTEIAGKTLGIIGLGAIGAKVANAAYALGMTVVGNSVVISDELAVPCAMYENLADMVAVCDYVSIHVPSLPDTKGMINKELIDHMKDGVILLNYARPDLIVESDVIDAVESGKISKYMTDLPDDNLVGRKNIVCTPHLGASTEEAEDTCAAMAATELMNYIENGNIVNSVNFPPLTVPVSENTKRVCVLFKDIDDIETVIRTALGSNIKALAIANSRTEYGYAIATVPDTSDVPEITAEGIIRVRVL